jgi:uncharacterized membrane protein YebE (DUF533 family)
MIEAAFAMREFSPGRVVAFGLPTDEQTHSLVRNKVAAANAAGAVELQDVPGVKKAVLKALTDEAHETWAGDAFPTQTDLDIEADALLAAIGAALKGK